MANIPPLSFDERDKKAVIAHLTPSLEGENAWEFACEKAQAVFNTILKEQQSITDYLGGKPLDSTIENGVLHIIYKGLGVVFVLGVGKFA